MSLLSSDVVATENEHARHFISQRGFEEILQACRPRNRGEYGSGLPISLSTVIKKFSPDVHHSMQSSEQMIALVRQERLSCHKSSSRAKNLESGARSFDEFNVRKLSPSPLRPQPHRMSTGSDSSSASSFNSMGSNMILSHPMSGVYLQSTTSLGDDSTTSLGIDAHGENPQEDNENPALIIESMMREHDKHAFTGRSGKISPANSFANSFK